MAIHPCPGKGLAINILKNKLLFLGEKAEILPGIGFGVSLPMLGLKFLCLGSNRKDYAGLS